MAAEAVRVVGLRELQRDFKRMSKDLSKELRDELKTVAEPIRADAEQRASAKGFGEKWSRIKTGVTVRGVYIAPFSRRAGGTPRPNFGVMLLDVMDAAAEDGHSEIEHGMEGMLDRLTRANGF